MLKKLLCKLACLLRLRKACPCKAPVKAAKKSKAKVKRVK